MNKNIFVLFLYLFFLGCANEQYRVRKPYLFEVRKENKIGYLFGTIHTGVLAEDLPEKFWPYFDKADIFVNEYDFSKINQKFTPDSFLFKNFADKKEEQIDSFLTNEEFLKFKKIILKSKKYSSPPEEKIHTLTTRAALAKLSLSLPKMRMLVPQGVYIRGESKFMMDKTLSEKSTAKVTDMLDSVNIKISSLCISDKNNDEENVNIIRQMLSTEHDINPTNEIIALAEAYRNGDTNRLMILTKESPKCLLEDRNKEWLFKMKRILENYETPFFAVGVAHIITEKSSLIELLTNEGYTVRRIDELDLDVKKDKNLSP